MSNGVTVASKFPHRKDGRPKLQCVLLVVFLGQSLSVQRTKARRLCLVFFFRDKVGRDQVAIFRAFLTSPKTAISLLLGDWELVFLRPHHVARSICFNSSWLGCLTVPKC